nr:alpha/beta hydrolase [Deinobacterium chartae]
MIVHGGPAFNAPGVAMRGLNRTVATATRELVRHFTLVFWDQRGSGKSRRGVPPESLNFEQYVRDTIELVDHLRERFGQDRIVLAGLSWGSAIAATVAARHPETLYAYVGLAQITNWAEADGITYRWALEEAQSRGNRRLLRALHRMGPPPYATPQAWKPLRAVLMQLGAMLYKAPGVKPPNILTEYVLPLLRSPDYSLGDALSALFVSTQRAFTPRMIADFGRINLFRDASRIDVPVHVLHGRHDRWVPSEQAARWVQALRAPSKRLVWLEKSSHAFHAEDQDAVERYLIDVVLPRVMTERAEQQLTRQR